MLKRHSYFFCFFSLSNSAILLKISNKFEGRHLFWASLFLPPTISRLFVTSLSILSSLPLSDSLYLLSCEENSFDCLSDLCECSERDEDEESLLFPACFEVLEHSHLSSDILRATCPSLTSPFKPGQLSLSELPAVALPSNLPPLSSFWPLEKGCSPSLMRLVMDFWLINEAEVLAGAGNHSSSAVLSLQDDTLRLCFLLLRDECLRLRFRFFDFLCRVEGDSSSEVEDELEDVEEELDLFLFLFILC